MFKSYKLDDMQASKRKLEELRASGGEHVYFAKFLTSEKVRKLFLNPGNNKQLISFHLALRQSLEETILVNSEPHALIIHRNRFDLKLCMQTI